MKRCFIFAILALAMIAVPAQAIDIQNFHTAIGSNNLFTLYTSDTLQPWQFVIGASSNMAGNPLVFSLPEDEELNVVTQMWSNQFYGAFGIAGYVDLGVAGSFNQISGEDLDMGSEVSAAFADDNNISYMGAGDVRVMIKGRILENKPRRVGIALVPFAHFPTGAAEYYNSAGAMDFGGLLVLDKRFDRVNIILNGGYKYKGISQGEGDDEEDIIPADEILIGLGMSIWAHRYVDVIVEVNGKTVDYGLENIDPEVPIEVDLGAKLYGGYGLSFLIGGGAGLTSGIGNPTYRGFLGFEFSYPKIDRKPPMTGSGGPAVDPNSKTEDSDRDGINNWDETNTYGTDFMNPDTDDDGLKDGEEINKYKTDPIKMDTDGDDLSDGEEIKLYKTNPLKTDTDDDTLADGVEVRELRTNPTTKDTDGDGIADNVDGAPNQAETVNGYQDNDGIPEVTLAKRPSGVIMFEELIWLPAKITWTGRHEDKIDDESLAMLNDVAVILTEYPDIKVQIECHVARGENEETNQKLTLRRAENIRAFLIKAGISEARLTAMGQGSDYPIASNASPEGREKNRRTMFTIIK